MAMLNRFSISPRAANQNGSRACLPALNAFLKAVRRMFPASTRHAFLVASPFVLQSS